MSYALQKVEDKALARTGQLPVRRGLFNLQPNMAGRAMVRGGSFATKAASKVLFNKYAGTGLMPMAMGLMDDTHVGSVKYTNAISSGVGYLGAQVAVEGVGAVAGMAGGMLAKTTTSAVGKFAGGALGALGSGLFVAGLAGSLLTPEGSLINEASKYVLGDKAGEWIGEQTEKVWKQSRGGFGSGSVVNTQNAMESRALMKALIRQSASNMLGQEGAFMHN